MGDSVLPGHRIGGNPEDPQIFNHVLFYLHNIAVTLFPLKLY